VAGEPGPGGLVKQVLNEPENVVFGQMGMLGVIADDDLLQLTL
jgi:hypothetical protein